jgi:glutamate synthase domain-containing protein 3
MALLKSLVENHARYSDSRRAQDILGNWPKWSRTFVKVMPTEYRRALKDLAGKNTAALKQKAA